MNRRRVWIVLALVAAGLLSGGLWYQHHKRYKHFAIHDPGLVYRAAWLEPNALGELIETYQIRSVVNLCTPGEMGEQRWLDERRAVTNAGARLFEEPLTLSIDANDPTVSRQMEILKNPNNYPMLVHCQHGVTRTAKFLLLYDVAFRGMSADQSLAAQPLWGRDDHNVNVKAFAHEFERQHRQLYPTAAAESLKVLR